MIGFVRRDTACRVRRFRERNIPLETFHRNVSKIKKQQAGHKGGAVLFAPPSKSCRFSHPPSPCARSMAQGISLSADSDLEGTCPLRESVLHLGACRLRRQIFREMKGKTEEILCGFPSIFLKYLGKDASKMCANRCKTDSKTSPAALSWSSLFGQTVLKSFCFCTTRFVFRRKAGTRRAVSAGLPRSFPAKKSTPTEVRVLFSLYHVRWRFPAHRRALCRGCR